MSASRPGRLDGRERGLGVAGSRSARRRAAAACTVIALSAWATTSCSSPAIRVRSVERGALGGAGAAVGELLGLLAQRRVEPRAVAHDLREQHRRRDAQGDGVHERGDVVR